MMDVSELAARAAAVREASGGLVAVRTLVSRAEAIELVVLDAFGALVLFKGEGLTWAWLGGDVFGEMGPQGGGSMLWDQERGAQELADELVSQARGLLPAAFVARVEAGVSA